MTVGEVITGILNLLTDFLIHFLEVFLLEINWWDANISMVIVVLIAYMFILGWLISLSEKFVDFLKWIYRYLTDSKYRAELRKDRKTARQAQLNLMKLEREKEEAEIEAIKAELSKFGRFLYFFKRHLGLTVVLGYLLLVIISISIPIFIDYLNGTL